MDSINDMYKASSKQIAAAERAHRIGLIKMKADHAGLEMSEDDIAKIVDHQRPNRAEYYLNIAKMVSERSTCLRKHWGAIIVKDDRIISTGYNGSPRGCTNCTSEGICWRRIHHVHRGTRYDLCRAVHAEQNAIIQASADEMKDATMYVYGWDVETEAPVQNPDSCQMCKRTIINAGIKQVVFMHDNNNVRTVDVSRWVNNGDVEPNLEGY